MPEDFVITALVGLSLLGTALLIAIWIAATRFETRYPVAYRSSEMEGADALEIFSVAGRGVTLRDLVALGLVTPTAPRGPARKKKPNATEAPKSEE